MGYRNNALEFFICCERPCQKHPHSDINNTVEGYLSVLDGNSISARRPRLSPVDRRPLKMKQKKKKKKKKKKAPPRTKAERRRAFEAREEEKALRAAAIDLAYPLHPPMWASVRGKGTEEDPYTFWVRLCERCRRCPTDPPANKQCCPYSDDFCGELRSDGASWCAHHADGLVTVAYHEAPRAVQEWASAEFRAQRAAYVPDDMADDWEGY
jgi:hypothetical protein